MAYRLAVIKDRQPHFILRGKAPSATPSQGGDEGGGDDWEQAGGGLVWRNFQERYPNQATQALESLVDHSAFASQSGGYLPPYLGIQRSASTTSTSKRASENGRSSIKIA